jgi:hypothetical protein
MECRNRRKTQEFVVKKRSSAKLTFLLLNVKSKVVPIAIGIQRSYRGVTEEF